MTDEDDDVEFWRYAVAHGETLLGYEEWEAEQDVINEKLLRAADTLRELDLDD